MNQALQNKTFVIIGGTNGLGFSAAKAFVYEGARVVVVGRNTGSVDQAESVLGEAARGLAGDATDPKTAPQAISLARQEFGGFDGLYHVAGGSGRSVGDGSLHEISNEGWLHTIDLNLTSVFNSNRAALQELIALNQSGVILNMTSVLADSPAPKHFATHAYTAAKAGIIGLTKAAAAQYSKQNIRVNAIAPALVATPMSGRAQANEKIMSYIKHKQPLDGGRIGLPEDVDGAAVFLMSDASRFTTGQVLTVDGGWNVSEGFE